MNIRQRRQHEGADRVFRLELAPRSPVFKRLRILPLQEYLHFGFDAGLGRSIH